MHEATPFGPWLKSRRKAHDWTQADLAAQAGCSAKTIEKIEAGALRPSKQLAELLAARLDVPPEDYPAFVQWARAVQWAGGGRTAGGTGGRVNLPTPPTALIGRDRDVARVGAAVARPDVRLVTLTGPPGIGKSRIALAVAAERRPDFPDGVVFVALAPISDPALVPSTVAGALGLREAVGYSSLAGVQDYLRDRRLLLVLDNFEQVAEAAPVVADLLAGAPALKILVTSRAVLHLRGEREFVVPPLGLPPRTATAAADLATVPAVALFMQSAGEVQPDFALTAENAAAVAAICRRLEGLPLAIELAAARIKILPPAALLARLASRLPLLTGGARDLPARQQTLHNAIAWSYDLLDPWEQALFRRMGVFVDGATLEAAEAVVGGRSSIVSRQSSALNDEDPANTDRGENTTPDPEPTTQSSEPVTNPHSAQRIPHSEPVTNPHSAQRIPHSAIHNPQSVLDGLAALVDKSLLRQTQSRGAARFLMLELIREYALEQLAASGEEAATRAAHLSYFLQLAETAQAQLGGGPAQVGWLNRLETEHDNLRAAWDWAATHDRTAAARLAAALGLFWQIRGHWSEGRERLTAALAWLPDPSPTRATALLHAGRLALVQSDLAAAEGLFTAAQGDSAQLGDHRSVANALIGLGQVAGGYNDFGLARTRFAESLTLRHSAGDRLGNAAALRYLGDLSLMEGDPGRTRAFYEESLTLYRERGDSWGVATLLTQLGHIIMSQGGYGQAQARFEESLAIQRELGNKSAIARTLNALVQLLLLQGDYGRTPPLLAESLAIQRELGSRADLADELHLMGEAALYAADFDRAARLLRESLTIAEEIGNRGIRAWVLNLLGQIALYRDQATQAGSLLEESLSLYQSLGLRGGASIVLGNLGSLAFAGGDLSWARTRWLAALQLHRELGNTLGLIFALERFAGLAQAQGHAARAVQLWGAAEARREALGAPQPLPERAFWAPALAAAQRTLPDSAFSAAWNAGRALALDAALAYALQPQE